MYYANNGFTLSIINFFLGSYLANKSSNFYHLYDYTSNETALVIFIYNLNEYFISSLSSNKNNPLFYENIL